MSDQQRKKFAARDVLDKLLRLKSAIPDAPKLGNVIIWKPTLRSDNGKTAD